MPKIARKRAGSERAANAANDAAMLAVRGTSRPFGPQDATAPMPWPESPQTRPVEWEMFSSFSDPLAGHIVAGRLQA